MRCLFLVRVLTLPSMQDFACPTTLMWAIHKRRLRGWTSNPLMSSQLPALEEGEGGKRLHEPRRRTPHTSSTRHCDKSQSIANKPVGSASPPRKNLRMVGGPCGHETPICLRASLAKLDSTTTCHPKCSPTSCKSLPQLCLSSRNPAHTQRQRCGAHIRQDKPCAGRTVCAGHSSLPPTPCPSGSHRNLPPVAALPQCRRRFFSSVRNSAHDAPPLHSVNTACTPRRHPAGASRLCVNGK